MDALIKIQAELKAPKSRKNTFGNYNYRSCEDILNAVKPLLSQYGCTLVLQDELKELCGQLFIEATAIIKNGKEEITVKSQAGIDLNKKGMDKAQTFGASSSYARKYALNGLFLIDDSVDADSTNTHEEKPKAKDVLNEVRFKKALEAIKTGDFTIQELEKRYELSETQQAQLNQLV